MTEQTETAAETETVEQYDYISRDDVARWDEEPTDERYALINVSPRNARDGQEGYLMEDTETGTLHTVNLDTNLLNPDYKITSVDVTLTIEGSDVTNIITDDLGRSVEYDHYISGSKVCIEYHTDDNGWDDEAENDDWDVVATVQPNQE